MSTLRHILAISLACLTATMPVAAKASTCSCTCASEQGLHPPAARASHDCCAAKVSSDSEGQSSVCCCCCHAATNNAAPCGCCHLTTGPCHCGPDCACQTKSEPLPVLPTDETSVKVSGCNLCLLDESLVETATSSGRLKPRPASHYVATAQPLRILLCRFTL